MCEIAAFPRWGRKVIRLSVLPVPFTYTGNPMSRRWSMAEPRLENSRQVSGIVIGGGGGLRIIIRGGELAGEKTHRLYCTCTKVQLQTLNL